MLLHEGLTCATLFLIELRVVHYGAATLLRGFINSSIDFFLKKRTFSLFIFLRQLVFGTYSEKNLSRVSLQQSSNLNTVGLQLY